MPANRPNLADLARRLLAGQRIPGGNLSRARAQTLGDFENGGLVRREESRRGVVFVVADAQGLRERAAREFPASEETHHAPSAGARNLITDRNTKAHKRRSGVLLLLFRGLPGTGVERNGSRIDIGALTARAGCAGVALGPTDRLTLAGECALIENPELFWAHGTAADLAQPIALFKDGRAPNRMVEWMKECPSARFWLHVDLDPVGLDEFLRLKKILGDRISLYVPDRVEELFQNFSNKKLVAPARSRRTLVKIKHSLLDSNIPEGTRTIVARILELIDTHHAGLEHEAFLAIPRSWSNGFSRGVEGPQVAVLSLVARPDGNRKG